MSKNVPIRQLNSKESCLEVRKKFNDCYGENPDFYVRVPGRVNLIGEHIDYCGYSVCPMALEQDIFLAASVLSDGQLVLQNFDSKFENFQCDLANLEIKIGEGAPRWYQYFLCGVKGIAEILPKGSSALKGMKVLVRGTVPQSAGLSSSSALVSAAALATSHANKFPLSKEEIANICAACERYIGTQGGGMDQAIAFLATEGCAKHIEFSPLRSADVALPKGAVFVIAHSLTNLNKAATADFNCRVAECRLAAQVMAKKSGLEWTTIKRLSDLQHSLVADLEKMISLTTELLHEQPYTKDEVVRELKTTIDFLNATSLASNTTHIESFKLRQRALHVFQEALRVKKFIETCQNSSDSNSLTILGELMSESHKSLRGLYECSHPQLDRLVELSDRLALGSRLTGAGWGGCVVSLLKSQNVPEYTEFIKREFYGKLGVVDGIEKVMFATEPKGGACIYVET